MCATAAGAAPPVGSEVQLTLSISAQQCEVSAKVARRIPADDGEYVGLEFVKVTPDFTRSVAEYLRTVLHDGPAAN